jgi:hypothetical protein
LQSGVQVADIVLALLMKADELCEMAQQSGLDLKKLDGRLPPLKH